MARSAKSQRAADALQDACCARKARSVYSSARTNPQATTLAPPELQKADEWLNKAADAALSKGDDVAVSQLAGLAKQQVAIAQETTKRKAPEQAVVDASAQRDQVRLAARAAEAEAVRRQRSSHGRPPTASCRISGTHRGAGTEAQAAGAKKTERGMEIALRDVPFALNLLTARPVQKRSCQENPLGWAAFPYGGCH